MPFLVRTTISLPPQSGFLEIGVRLCMPRSSIRKSVNQNDVSHCVPGKGQVPGTFHHTIPKTFSR